MPARLKQRAFGHLTPRYVVDRLRLIAHERLNPDAPWLTAEAVTFLEAWLRPQHVGFEWGSGRSTVWFAARVRRLTSVEHDPDWYRETGRRLEVKELCGRVTYRYVPSDDQEPGETHPYVSVISGHDGGLDFCLVDGVTGLRAYCALACLAKLKPNGVLIVDNANWFIPRSPKSRAPNSRALFAGYASVAWSEFARRTADWQCIWTTNGITDTALWVRPP